MTSSQKVYLCGGINGLTDDEATTWRERVKAQLGAERCVDPMRRDYRGREDGHAAEIVNGDLEDISACDVVLANCVRPSWGTAMEIFHAARWCPTVKTIIAVVPAGQPVSPWLRYHTSAVVTDLELAIDLLI